MAAKRTGAASGNRKTATRKRNTQSAGRKTSSRAAQNRAKTAKNPRTFSKEEELRGIQLRRDIRLILLLFGMGFLFIAELGMAGPVGRVFSDIAFGLFGLPAYVLPFFLFFLVLFIVSNKDNASVWFKTAACIVLFLCAGIICELQSGRMKAEAFSLQEAYLLSIQEHSGGGILSGGITWMLYHALKMGGTILVLTALIIICVIILTQRSFTMLLRDLRDSRNAQEGPGILERGRNALTEHRDRARERREYRRELEEEERERRREERLQRRREMEAAREEEILGIRRGPDPVDLDDLTIGAPADEAEDTYDYGARRPSGDRSPYAYDAEPDDGPADDCEEPGYTDEYTAYEVGEEDPYGGYPGDEETSIHSYRLGTDELHEITSSAPRGSVDGPVRRVSITVQPKAPSTGRVIKKFGAAGGVLGGREYTEETAAPSMSPVELPPEEELPEAARRLRDLFARLPGMAEPRVLLDGDGDVTDLFAFPYLSRDLDRQRRCPTLSAAVEQCFSGRDAKDRIRQKSASMVRLLKGQVERCERKLALQEEELASAERMEEYRVMGELINANLYQLSKGQTEALLDNFYDPEQKPLRVPLDIRLTPAQNAQRYFKRYQKARAARVTATEQREKTLRELDYLEGMLLDVDKCAGESELEEIREELARTGYMKRVTNRREKRALPASKPYRYLSADGIEIHVGKNAVQNERLTQSARPNELWLHAKDMPGSHVLIRCEGEVPLTTLRQAAQLAAWYSKGQHSANVPVDYTLRRHVKKPSGTAPGFVIYTNQHTAYITPDEAEIRKIRLIEA